MKIFMFLESNFTDLFLKASSGQGREYSQSFCKFFPGDRERS